MRVAFVASAYNVAPILAVLKFNHAMYDFIPEET